MIPATTGKKPDHVEDSDLASLDELRGNMEAISKAKLSMGEKATVAGIRAEMNAMKKIAAEDREQMNRLVGLYQTVKNQLDELNIQRIKELTVKVNGGSTSPEDM